MSWRVAKSLESFRNQINALSPNRSKASDGTIGDAAHATKNSDHNPWVKSGTVGIVTAMDITNDPAHGVLSQAIADALIASRDDRIKYVISNRKIAAGTDGPSPWQWRSYGGSNPHSHHVHLSVKSDASHYDNTSPWNLDGVKVKASESAKAPADPGLPILALGVKGLHVESLQRLLNKAGFKLTVDAIFGPKTDTAVRMFQKQKGLVQDGQVGPYTWQALG